MAGGLCEHNKVWIGHILTFFRLFDLEWNLISLMNVF